MSTIKQDSKFTTPARLHRFTSAQRSQAKRAVEAFSRYAGHRPDAGQVSALAYFAKESTK
jgi:hypothetical protein